jgi:hypothetical protein
MRRRRAVLPTAGIGTVVAGAAGCPAAPPLDERVIPSSPRC